MKQAFLVDDSKSARIVLSRLLKKNGFDEVAMAESGEQALEQLKTLTPDAIFVDFLMDGMDGLETITEIKKDPRFATTPVVMCTANEGDEYVRAAVDHGALGILAKPPTDESLGAIITLIEEHQRDVVTGETVRATAGKPRIEVPAGETAAAPEVSLPPPAAPSEQEVRRIAAEVAAQSQVQVAEKAVVETLGKVLEAQVGDAVSAYLDSHLKPLVIRLVEQRVAALEPPKVDTESLRDQVVGVVNRDLEEFVRQLNQRTVEGLIEAAVYKQTTEVAKDFSARLKESEQRILSLVPEKGEMIENIRIITEGSLEAQVRETATHVAREISNSVATETVEYLLDQHVARQATATEKGSGGVLTWTLALLAMAAIGGGLYYYFSFLQ